MSLSNRARGIAPAALALFAALALLAALVTGYATRALFDSEQFANRATASLDDEAVQAEVARRVTDDLVLKAESDLIAVRPVIEGVVSEVVGGGAFQSLFRAAVGDVHSAVFERNEDSLILTVADVGAVVRGALQALAPGLARKIPAGTRTEVLDSDPPGVLVEAAQISEDIRELGWLLLAAGLAAGAGALAISADRRRTALQLGVAMVTCGVLALIGLVVVHALVQAAIDEAGARDAIDGIWSAFLDDLRAALLIFACSGAVVAAAASSLLRPVDVGAPVRRAWELVATVPESRRMRAARGAALLAAGIAIIAWREAVVDLLVIVVGLYVAHAGASELMRLTIAVPDAGGAPPARLTRPGVIGGALALGAIAATAAIFVATGGVSEGRPPPADPGCNGDEALCARTLDEVAFAATHNSMSAVTNPGWLFGQQDAGIPDQLDDGIRALLIDTHYGIRTADGTIKTDLSDLGSRERAAYEEELGTEALDAALRIRDRIVGSKEVGERDLYLCHGFCELGALRLEDTLRQVRDFVIANPREVVVIVNEDYVSPADFADEVESSGLIDYVYDGPDGPPWPTLSELGESGGRVIVMAENDAGQGTIPWYRQAYDLVEETPYTFKTPAALTDPKQLPRSCEPNRGPEDASLFLVNHWVDTSPAPRPSNAQTVNAGEPLLRRVRECERIRELDANLIAVDFYRVGDLFEVVSELNAGAGAPGG